MTTEQKLTRDQLEHYRFRKEPHRCIVERCSNKTSWKQRICERCAESYGLTVDTLDAFTGTQLTLREWIAKQNDRGFPEPDVETTYSEEATE